MYDPPCEKSTAPPEPVTGTLPRRPCREVTAMPITDLRMQNFRSFSDETTLQFKPGLNVLVSTSTPRTCAHSNARPLQ